MQIEAWDLVAKEVDFNLEIDISEFERLVPKDAAILDYGCGYGRISNQLSTDGYLNIVGVDTSPEMIKRGSLKYPFLSLHHSNRSKLQYTDGKFKAIILCAVLTCIPEQHLKQEILTEITRLLTPGGILHVIEFCSDTSNIFESKLGVRMHHQKPSELNKLLSAFTELKFEVIHTQTMRGEDAKAVSYFGQKTLNKTNSHG